MRRMRSSFWVRSCVPTKRGSRIRSICWFIAVISDFRSPMPAVLSALEMNFSAILSSTSVISTRMLDIPASLTTPGSSSWAALNPTEGSAFFSEASRTFAKTALTLAVLAFSSVGNPDANCSYCLAARS